MDETDSKEVREPDVVLTEVLADHIFEESADRARALRRVRGKSTMFKKPDSVRMEYPERFIGYAWINGSAEYSEAVVGDLKQEHSDFFKAGTTEGIGWCLFYLKTPKRPSNSGYYRRNTH